MSTAVRSYSILLSFGATAYKRRMSSAPSPPTTVYRHLVNFGFPEMHKWVTCVDTGCWLDGLCSAQLVHRSQSWTALQSPTTGAAGSTEFWWGDRVSPPPTRGLNDADWWCDCGADMRYYWWVGQTVAINKIRANQRGKPNQFMRVRRNFRWIMKPFPGFQLTITMGCSFTGIWGPLFELPPDSFMPLGLVGVTSSPICSRWSEFFDIGLPPNAEIDRRMSVHATSWALISDNNVKSFDSHDWEHAFRGSSEAHSLGFW